MCNLIGDDIDWEEIHRCRFRALPRQHHPPRCRFDSR
jgi:hypothetical protein